MKKVLFTVLGLALTVVGALLDDKKRDEEIREAVKKELDARQNSNNDDDENETEGEA